MLKWLHSFHLYATHFWIDHLLAFAKLEPSLSLAGSTVTVKVAYELANILSAANAVTRSSDLYVSNTTDGEVVAGVIRNHGVLYDVVREELGSRELAGGSSRNSRSMI